MPSLPKAASRVLIVEDDHQCAMLICAVVAGEGRTPVAVCAFGEALVELKRAECDLVLLDLTLPDSSAVQTIESIPDLLARGAKRVVVVTGYPITDAIRDASLASGAKAIISKDGPDFIQRVVKVMDAGNDPPRVARAQ